MEFIIILVFSRQIFFYREDYIPEKLQTANIKTCLQRPPFWGPIFTFCNIKLPLNNDHLSTTAWSLGSRGWSLYTGLTVVHILSKKILNKFSFLCITYYLNNGHFHLYYVILLIQKYTLIMQKALVIPELCIRNNPWYGKWAKNLVNRGKIIPIRPEKKYGCFGI